MSRPFVVLAALMVWGILGVRSAQAQALVTETATPASQHGDHRVLVERLQSRLDNLLPRLEVLRDQVGLLRDTALGGDIGETRAIIRHRNALGSAFVLERARYLLDGGVLLDREDANGNFSSISELALFDGQIGAGDHALEVEVVCRGGGFGFFSYVEAYRFRVTSRYVFRVREGRVNRLDIVVYQKPSITLEAAKRLTIRYDVSTDSDSKKAEDRP